MRRVLSGLLLALLAACPAGAQVEESNLDIDPVQSWGDAPPQGKRTAAMDARRAADVEASLRRVREQLHAIGDPARFRKQLAPLFAENQAAAKAGAARWVGDAYFAAGPVAQNPRFGNFAAGIIAWRDYLKKHGVDLVVLRVPSRHETAFPHFVSGKITPGVLDPAYLQLAEQLLAADVEYIDGLEAMHRRGTEYPLSYWYMLPREGHPAEGLSRILADELAGRLERYQLPRTGDYRLTPRQDLYRRENYPAGNPRFPANQPVLAAAVVDAAGKTPEITERNTSPLLFCSDSYGAYPGVKVGASIPHYIAQRLGHLPDWQYRNGSSGGAPVFLYRKGPEFLRGRLVVVAICHPGNLFGRYATIPPAELQELPQEQWTVLRRFDATNWPTLPSSPGVGQSGGRAFALNPDGTLQLWPLKPGAVNGDAGRIAIPLSAAERQRYRAFAFRPNFGQQYYLTMSVTAGAAPHYEYVSNSERVPAPLMPVEAAPDAAAVTLEFNNVSINGRQASALQSLELLGLAR